MAGCWSSLCPCSPLPQQPPAMQPSWSTAAIAVTVLLVAKSSGMAVPASGRGKIVSKLDGKFTSTTSFAGQMMLRCDLDSNVSAAVVDSIREDFGTPTPRARTFPWGRMSGERWIWQGFLVGLKGNNPNPPTTQIKSVFVNRHPCMARTSAPGTTSRGGRFARRQG